MYAQHILSTMTVAIFILLIAFLFFEILIFSDMFFLGCPVEEADPTGPARQRQLPAERR